jgi:hypothetical protein
MGYGLRSSTPDTAKTAQNTSFSLLDIQCTVYDLLMSCGSFIFHTPGIHWWDYFLGGSHYYLPQF